MGDSNVRALYKDLVWLLCKGDLIPQHSLKMKNERSHANDRRLSDGALTSGRHYMEVREYAENGTILHFEFLTSLDPEKVKRAINSFGVEIDIIVLNSCVWDLTRWGPEQVTPYKKRINEVFKYVAENYSTTRLIWLTTLPVSFIITRGFLKPQVVFMRNALPWHILESNNYASQQCKFYKHDLLDVHNHVLGIQHHRTKDGIHWEPGVMRQVYTRWCFFY